MEDAGAHFLGQAFSDSHAGTRTHFQQSQFSGSTVAEACKQADLALLTGMLLGPVQSQFGSALRRVLGGDDGELPIAEYCWYMSTVLVLQSLGIESRDRVGLHPRAAAHASWLKDFMPHEQFQKLSKRLEVKNFQGNGSPLFMCEAAFNATASTIRPPGGGMQATQAAVTIDDYKMRCEEYGPLADLGLTVMPLGTGKEKGVILHSAVDAGTFLVTALAFQRIGDSTFTTVIERLVASMVGLNHKRWGQSTLGGKMFFMDRGYTCSKTELALLNAGGEYSGTARRGNGEPFLFNDSNRGGADGRTISVANGGSPVVYTAKPTLKGQYSVAGSSTRMVVDAYSQSKPMLGTTSLPRVPYVISLETASKADTRQLDGSLWEIVRVDGASSGVEYPWDTIQTRLETYTSKQGASPVWFVLRQLALTSTGAKVVLLNADVFGLVDAHGEIHVPAPGSSASAATRVNPVVEDCLRALGGEVKAIVTASDASVAAPKFKPGTDLFAPNPVLASVDINSSDTWADLSSMLSKSTKITPITLSGGDEVWVYKNMFSADMWRDHLQQGDKTAGTSKRKKFIAKVAKAIYSTLPAGGSGQHADGSVKDALRVVGADEDVQREILNYVSDGALKSILAKMGVSAAHRLRARAKHYAATKEEKIDAILTVGGPPDATAPAAAMKLITLFGMPRLKKSQKAEMEVGHANEPKILKRLIVPSYRSQLPKGIAEAVRVLDGRLVGLLGPKTHWGVRASADGILWIKFKLKCAITGASTNENHLTCVEFKTHTAIAPVKARKALVATHSPLVFIDLTLRDDEHDRAAALFARVVPDFGHRSQLFHCTAALMEPEFGMFVYAGDGGGVWQAIVVKFDRNLLDRYVEYAHDVLYAVLPCCNHEAAAPTEKDISDALGSPPGGLLGTHMRCVRAVMLTVMVARAMLAYYAKHGTVINPRKIVTGLPAVWNAVKGAEDTVGQDRKALVKIDHRGRGVNQMLIEKGFIASTVSNVKRMYMVLRGRPLSEFGNNAKMWRAAHSHMLPIKTCALMMAHIFLRLADKQPATVRTPAATSATTDQHATLASGDRTATTPKRFRSSKSGRKSSAAVEVDQRAARCRGAVPLSTRPPETKGGREYKDSKVLRRWCAHCDKRQSKVYCANCRLFYCYGTNFQRFPVFEKRGEEATVKTPRFMDCMAMAHAGVAPAARADETSSSSGDESPTDLQVGFINRMRSAGSNGSEQKPAARTQKQNGKRKKVRKVTKQTDGDASEEEPEAKITDADFKWCVGVDADNQYLIMGARGQRSVERVVCSNAAAEAGKRYFHRLDNKPWVRAFRDGDRPVAKVATMNAPPTQTHTSGQVRPLLKIGWGACVCAVSAKHNCTTCGGAAPLARCPTQNNRALSTAIDRLDAKGQADGQLHVAMYLKKECYGAVPWPWAPVSVFDVRTLLLERGTHGVHISANILTAMIELYNERLAPRVDSDLKNIVVVPSQWWSELEAPNGSVATRAYLLAQRLCVAGLTLDTVDTLLFAIGDGQHFVLVEADMSAKCKNDKRKLYMYNSIVTYHMQNCVETLPSVLEGVFRIMKTSFDGKKEYTFSQEPWIFKPTPQQTDDGNDCGISTLMCIRHIISGAKQFRHDGSMLTKMRTSIYDQVMAHQLVDWT